MTNSKGKRLSLAAAIDVGSHETVLRVASMSHGKPPKDIEVVHQTLALGSDTYVEGTISQTLLNRLIEVLDTFQTTLKVYGPMPVLAYATSAIREADNALYALDQVRTQTGVAIEILPNSLETSLHLQGLSVGLDDAEALAKDTTLIVDVRAGSLQLSMFDRGVLAHSMNFRLGALRVRELLGDLERETGNYFSLLTEYIGGDLRYYTRLGPKRATISRVVIIGGGMRFLRHLLGLPNATSRVTKNAFDALFQSLAGHATHHSLVDTMPLEQRALMLPTAIIINEVLRFTDAEVFDLPKFSLSSCVLTDLAVRDYGLKIAYNVDLNVIAIARRLARRYRIDKDHAGHVETLALRLFDLTKKLHRLPPRSRVLLNIAAIVHNVGKYVAVHDDGHYTKAIVEATEWVGLTPDEKHLLALVACHHNGHVDVKDISGLALSSDMQMTMMKLVALLTVANALDAGHAGKIVIDRVVVSQKGLKIVYVGDADVTLERWTLRQHQSVFTRVFGLTPYLERHIGRRVSLPHGRDA